MRKNNKGISMISLVVVIISIIILSALAIGAGYRYMQESERAEKATLTSIISEAAYKRQNDYNVDAKSYYEGSVILNSGTIVGIPLRLVNIGSPYIASRPPCAIC